MGDFNEIMAHSERAGGSSRLENFIDAFPKVLLEVDCGSRFFGAPLHLG